MQILEVTQLKIGQRFSLPLFHSSGRKLLSAQTELSQLHVDALLRTGVTQVFMAENAKAVLDFAQTAPTLLSVRDLRLGQVAETDLMTPDGVVIVQQNEQIEEHHIAALGDSGIDYLIPRAAADAETVCAILQDLARVVLARVDTQIKRGEYLRAPEDRDPLKNNIPKPTGQEILNLNAIQLLRRRLSSRLQPVFGLLETGKSPPLEALESTANDLLDLMRTEPRQFCQLAMSTQRREDHLPDHSISVAVLAMAIATQMNLSLSHVREVIMGALLFDVGMLVVPKRVRTGSGALIESDRQRIQQHPIFSLTMMEQIPGLSPIPRMMGYQHHERLNGSGYPHQTPGTNISEFARIISVADVFAASTNPRAYKSSKLPYTAMEELVHLAHRALLDVRPVKALLSAIGLFPIGSYVLLSNNINAEVIGANETRIDRPLVTPLNPAGLPTGTLVDLNDPQYGHIKIAKAIPAPTRTEAAKQLAG